MRAFHFTLQKLLDVKQTLENQAKGDLAAANARLKRVTDVLTQLSSDLLSQEDNYQVLLESGKASASELALLNIGFRAMFERIARQKQTIERATEEKMRIQQNLLKLMQERKTLEKLKENERALYLEESKKEDMAMIDDFMSNTINRQGEMHRG
jgi:flagellar FliJ protein